MADSLHSKRYPNESDDYRSARNDLLRAEMDLRQQLENVAHLRRNLPAGGEIREDYAFSEGHGDFRDTQTVRPVHLSELFEPGKDSLILYSFMFGPDQDTPCPACNSITDGFNGLAEHVMARVNFAMVAKAPIGKFRAWAAARGWTNLRLLSSEGTPYNQDYFAETEDGAQLPAINVFRRDGDGTIRHFYSTELLYAPSEGHPRHADLFWPIWNLFDITPDGRGTDWFPKYLYE